jgi:hypothetical protein
MTPARVAGWVGLVALLPLLVLFLVSGLVAPQWAVAFFLLLWCVLLVTAVLSLRRRPLLVALLPVAGLAVWFVVLQIGDAFFGWSA